jgi:hypothetical protein
MKCPWPKCNHIIGYDRQMFLRHYRRHTNEPEFLCEWCQNRFWTAKRFQNHQNNLVCRNRPQVTSEPTIPRKKRRLTKPPKLGFDTKPAFDPSDTDVTFASAPASIALLHLWLDSDHAPAPVGQTFAHKPAA